MQQGKQFVCEGCRNCVTLECVMGFGTSGTTDRCNLMFLTWIDRLTNRFKDSFT